MCGDLAGTRRYLQLMSLNNTLSMPPLLRPAFRYALRSPFKDSAAQWNSSSFRYSLLPGAWAVFSMRFPSAPLSSGCLSRRTSHSALTSMFCSILLILKSRCFSITVSPFHAPSGFTHTISRTEPESYRSKENKRKTFRCPTDRLPAPCPPLFWVPWRIFRPLQRSRPPGWFAPNPGSRAVCPCSWHRRPA